MNGEKQQQPVVTDEEIARIIRDQEAGVADVLQAYDNSERYYFAAVTAQEATITYGSNTVPL